VSPIRGPRHCDRLCAGCAIRFLAGWRAPVDEGLEAAFFAREVSVAGGDQVLEEPEPHELYVPDLPFNPPSLGVVLRIALPSAAACSPHLIGIRPLTPDGRLVATEATVVLPAEDISRPTPGLVVRTTVVVEELTGLSFDRPGRHALVVFLDGEPVASLPLRISG
jgi:hypothetical protein